MHHQDKNHSYRSIFPHPDRFGELVGYEEIPGKSSTEEAHVQLNIQEHHLSPSGAVHGGVLSTFADYAMGAALFRHLQPGQRCSTIEFKINYISPVQLGERLIAQSKVIHLGRSHAIIEASLSVDDKTVAKTLGTYNIYSPRQKE